MPEELVPLLTYSTRHTVASVLAKSRQRIVELQGTRYLPSKYTIRSLANLRRGSRAPIQEISWVLADSGLVPHLRELLGLRTRRSASKVAFHLWICDGTPLLWL